MIIIIIYEDDDDDDDDMCSKYFKFQQEAEYSQIKKLCPIYLVLTKYEKYLVNVVDEMWLSDAE